MLHSPAIPRAGRPPERGRTYRLRHGAYAVLRRGDDVLLTRQVTEDVDELQLPGGGIDPGETPLRALVRELREETGYTTIVRARLGTFRIFTYMPDYGFHAEKLCHIYLACPGLRLGPPEEAGHSAIWLPLAVAARRVASPGAQAILRKLAA
ncbi:NUDIX domain-containing protein [Jannaschia marina]|uniref:NUDIX domain-containing protein n=1 Tax=Jannaschia marina TaxID=2741674 RepID=UPI0015C97519|nr:NUDIX hydrolase [Jannaschia marina]